MKMKVCLINVAGKKDKTEVIRFAQSIRADVLICSEAEYDDRQSALHCGLAARLGLQNNGAKVEAYNCSGRFELGNPFNSLCQCVIKVPELRITMCAWYLKPSQRARNQSEDRVSEVEIAEELAEEAFRKKRSRFIHLGDINGRVKNVGPGQENSRGRKLFDAACEGDYTIINDKRWTYRSHAVRTKIKKGILPVDTDIDTSAIDWVMVSSDLLGMVDFDVQPNPLGGDHEIIVLHINLEKQMQHEVQLRIKPAKFLKFVKSNTDPREWSRIKRQAVQHSLEPVQRKRFKKAQLPSEINFLQQVVNKMGKAIARGRGTNDFLRPSYETFAKQLKSMKNKFFATEEFQRLTKVNKTTMYTQAFVKAKCTQRALHLVKDGKAMDGKEAGEELLKLHFDGQPSPLRPLPKDLMPFDKPFTDYELEDIFRRTIDTAPGPDQISYSLLAKWSAAVPGFFKQLFNDWYLTGSFPAELREAEIITLTKPGREPTPEGVRPIVKINCIGKLYEKLVDQRAYWWAEKCNLIPSEQVGARDGIGCEHIINAITLTRDRSQLEGKNEVIVSLDTQRAYGSIPHQAVIDTLIYFKFPGNIVSIIHQYLSDRTVYTNFNQKRSQMNVTRGVGQGQVLSSRLFTYTTAGIYRKLRAFARTFPEIQIKCYSYCDDIFFQITANQPLRDLLLAACALVKRSQSVLAELKLELAVVKTCVMVSEKNFLERTLRFCGQQIITVPQIKVLGGIMTHDRLPTKHIMHIEKRIKNVMEKNMKLLRNKSGIDYEVRKHFALTSIYPIANYAAGGWARWNLHAPSVNKLKALNTVVMRAVTLAPPTASFAATAVLSGMRPLHIQAQIAARVSHVRTSGIFESNQVELPVKMCERPHPAKWIGVTITGEVRTQEQMQMITQNVRYFTDGSRIDQEESVMVGAAYVYVDSNNTHTTEMFKLPEYCTVFQAEKYAVQQVLIDIKDKADRNKQVAMFSDSYSALQALQQFKTSDEITFKCQQLIREIKALGVNLYIYFIKAHCGFQYNEMADKAAKLACQQGKQVSLNIPMKYIRRKFQDEADQRWEADFAKDRYGRTARLFFPTPSDPALKSMVLNNQTVKIYTGHGENLESRRFGFSGSNVNCPCGEQQTMIHLITECPLREYENMIAAKAASLDPVNFTLPWDELRMLPAFHRYIAKRAEGLNSELRVANAVYIESSTLECKMFKMHISPLTGSTSSRIREKRERSKLFSLRKAFSKEYDVKWSELLSCDELKMRKYLYSDNNAA